MQFLSANPRSLKNFSVVTCVVVTWKRLLSWSYEVAKLNGLKTASEATTFLNCWCNPESSLNSVRAWSGSNYWCKSRSGKNESFLHTVKWKVSNFELNFSLIKCHQSNTGHFVNIDTKEVNNLEITLCFDMQNKCKLQNAVHRRDSRCAFLSIFRYVSL